MTTYYTGKGDSGVSSLGGGSALPKDEIVFSVLGEMDELNSFIGLALLSIKNDLIKHDLQKVQDNLFSISAVFTGSYNNETAGKAKVPDTGRLEQSIEKLSKELPELKKFVVPGGSINSCHLHICRAISRRVERSLVALHRSNNFDESIIKYFNRLSSFLFVAALYENYAIGMKERNPEYEQ